MSDSVNNIIYAADETLRNTFRLGLDFREPVQIAAMEQAAAQTARRFPYFAVQLIRQGETYRMARNNAPFVFADGGRPIRLNSEESNGHLVAFAVEGNRLFLDTSHFITDGNGVFPFIRTLLYSYLSLVHPEAEFDTSWIALPDSAIPAAELEDDPYPSEPIPAAPMKLSPRPAAVFRLPDQPQGYANMGGWTSYLFRVPQKELMRFVSSVDGSPATFVASLLYRAVDELHPENRLPVVCGMQHQFRHALGKPQSHLCHVNIVPIVYPPSLRGAEIDRLNTIGRGSLILRADDENDLITVNAHIRNEKAIRSMTLPQKREFMRRVVTEGIGVNTFEVSYTGRVAWGGLDRYVSFVAPYLDLTLSGGVSAEIFSRDTDFDVTIMQRNGDPKLYDRLCEQLTAAGIHYDPVRTEHFAISGFELP